jgi:CubicO group peptidase (beta-lactamase class C family)
MNVRITCFTAVLLVACASGPAPGTDREIRSRSARDSGADTIDAAVDAFVTHQMRAMKIPGLALVVMRNARVVKQGAYGVANIETGTTLNTGTAFRIASLSKEFIATAVLLLVQERKLDLDDKVGRFLSNVPTSWSSITIRQLLTHTSGIVRDPVDYHPYAVQPITAVIESAYALQLNASPGARFLYSNIGYYVLSEVITKASGESWDRFIAARLFVPAGMASTRLASVTEIIPSRASGYQMDNGILVNAENWIAIRPSSAFISTAADLARWEAFTVTRNPLTAANRTLMRTRARLNDGTETDYGFGLYVESFLGRSRVHHDGQYPGFRAEYERFVDDSVSVIVLANADMSGLQAMSIKIAGYYAANLSTPPFTLSATAPSESAAASTIVPISITATNRGQAAPNSVLELEIWDESGRSVYKTHRSNEDFSAGETRTFSFSWTPARSGKYSINVGMYGPKWCVSYAWKESAGSVTVK